MRRFFYASRIWRMTLRSSHKIAILFFACSLGLGYVFANLRHAEKSAAIAEQFERVESLHESTDKLVAECKEEEKTDHDRFGIERKVCDQGQEEHDRTQRRMEKLEAAQVENDHHWYINFALAVLLINGLGYAAVRLYGAFKDEPF